MFAYVISVRPPKIATNPVVSFDESSARTLSTPARVQPTARRPPTESRDAPRQTAVASGAPGAGWTDDHPRAQEAVASAMLTNAMRRPGEPRKRVGGSVLTTKAMDSRMPVIHDAVLIRDSTGFVLMMAFL